NDPWGEFPSHMQRDGLLRQYHLAFRHGFFMSKQDQAKRAVAEAAFAYVREGEYLGVGTGSTVNHFIDVLAERQPTLEGCVSSSEASSARLKDAGFDVIDLNSAGELGVYID